MIINTDISKKVAYQAVNGSLKEDIPNLKKFASQVGRVAGVMPGAHSETDDSSVPARSGMKRGRPDAAQQVEGFAVRANIRFKAKDPRHTDIIVEMESSSRLKGLPSVEEVRILRSLLWRIGRLVMNGLHPV